MAWWRLVLGSALVLGAACGRSVGSTGSNTNWLSRCSVDAECGANGTCWCGACTKTCDDASACVNGTCQAGDELGCGTPSGASVCVAECSTNTDCAKHGAGVECVNGACLPAASGMGGTTGNGTGGQGAAGQASGGSGAGGSGVGGDGAEGGADTAGGPPVGVPTEPGGATLAVSDGHICYVWRDANEPFQGSQLYCWGGNRYGQSSALLPGRVELTVDYPRKVVTITDPVAIAVSDEHSCALTAAGEVYCWGLNDYGQVGSSNAPPDTCTIATPEGGEVSYVCNPEPQRVEGVENAVRIAVARGHSCALIADGTVRCWGGPDQLADWVGSLPTATSVALGNAGACVTDTAGAAICSFGITPDVGRIDDVALQRSREGVSFGCLNGPSGVHCFGDGFVGELGTGLPSPEGAPRALSGAKAIAVGAAHACALGADGVVRCWGRNTYGALGTPPGTSPVCGGDYCEALPLAVSGLPEISALGAGGDRTCAAGTDRTLWCWGSSSMPVGALERIGGPWEPGPEECSSRVADLTAERRESILLAMGGCVTDADCTTVSVDLSCARSCSLGAVPASAAAKLESEIAGLEAKYCAASWGCSIPEAACPAPTTRAVCLYNACVVEDPAHSGCDDACGCAARRSAQSNGGGLQNECAGFDLWPLVGISCGSCTEPTAAIVVGNRGGARFSGDATLSFEHIGGQSDPPLPDPVTVALDVGPGEVSQAIHVQSRGAGDLTVRVTATGDCNSVNDASTQVEFPPLDSICN